MERAMIEIGDGFVSIEERARLVGLCARITGSVDAAEDLAQETLLEAWRHAEALRRPDRRSQWLSGIARNVCLRWMRAHGRESARLVAPHSLSNGPDTSSINLENSAVDELDIEVELERKELLELLERALAALPEQTRQVLLKRYVEESSLAEIAGSLGTNANAIAMRLQRGKLLLRRILTQELSEQIAAYGVDTTSSGWEMTPLWCHLCGRQRLLGKHDSIKGTLMFKCPTCSPGREEVLNNSELPLLRGGKSYRPMISRLMNWCDEYYRAGLRTGTLPCMCCGRSLPVFTGTIAQYPAWMSTISSDVRWAIDEVQEQMVCVPCEHSRLASWCSLDFLSLCLPQGRHFFKQHPKIRTLPKQEVEVNGRRAFVTRHESITEQATFTVVSAADTFQVLFVDGGAL